MHTPLPVQFGHYLPHHFEIRRTPPYSCWFGSSHIRSERDYFSPVQFSGIGYSFMASAATTLFTPVDVTPTCHISCTRCDHGNCSFPLAFTSTR